MWSVGLAAGALILLLALVVFLGTPLGGRVVLALVARQLARQEIVLSAAGFRLNPIELSVTVEDGELRRPDRAQPPFVTVARLEADVSLTELLQPRYVVESATVDGLAVHYAIGRDGRSNLPGPQADAAPGRPGDGDGASPTVDYFVASLTATDTSLRYEDLRRDVDVTLPIQVATVRGNPETGRHAVTLEASGGLLRQAQRVVALDQASVTADLGADDVRIEHARVSAERSTLEVAGTIASFEMPVVELDLLARADVPRVAALAGVGEPAAGTIDIDGQVEGAIGGLRATATVDGSGLGYRALTGLQLDARVAYDQAAQTLAADLVRLRAAWGRLEGRAGVALEDGRSTAALRLDDLDVQAVSRALDVPVPIATRVDATVDARWPALDLFAVSGRADVELDAPARAGARAPRGPDPLPASGALTVLADDGDLLVEVARLDLAGTHSEGRVALRARTALDGELRTTIADVGRTADDVQAATQALEGQRQPPGGPDPSLPLSGHATLVTRLRGNLSAPVAAVTIDAPALAVPRAGTGSLHAELTYDDGTVRVPRLEAALGEARAVADARIDLGTDRRIEADVNVEGADVGTLLAVAGRDPAEASGRLDVRAHVQGTVARPEVAMTVAGEGLVVQGEEAGRLNAGLSVRGDVIQVDTLTLRRTSDGDAARLQAAGSYAIGTGAYDIELDARDWTLSRITLPDGRVLGGRVGLQVSAAGTIADPEGRLTATVDEATLGDRPLGRITVAGVVAGMMADVTVDAETFGLDARAQVSTAAPYEGRLQAAVTDLDVSSLPVELPGSLTGRVTLRVEASGAIQEWRDARLEAQFDRVDGTWNGRPFALSSPGALAWNGRRLTVDGLTLSAGGSRAALSGTLPLEATQAGRDSEGLTVSAHLDLPSLAAFAPPAEGWDVTGTAELTGTVGGSLRALDPRLELRLEDAMAFDPQRGRGITDVTLAASVRDGRVTIDPLRGAWNTAFLTATAEFPLAFVPSLPVAPTTSADGAAVTATLVGLNPATVPGVPDLVTGNIGASLTLTAAAPALEAVDATLTFTDLSTWLGSFELAQRSATTVALRDGTASITAMDLGGTAGTFTAAGSMGLVGPRPLDARVQGTLETVVLSAFVDGLTASGQVEIDATAGGTLAAPDLAGAVTMNDVAMAMDEPTLAAEGLTARIELEGPDVTVRTFEGELNGGSVTVAGGLTLGEGLLQDVDLRVDATDIAFDAPLELRSLSDSHVTLTSRQDGLQLQGSVSLKEAGLTGDVNFDTGLLATLTGPPSLDLTEERNPLIDRLRLDVEVTTATPILVDNNLARAEVTTDLRVVGTPYDTGLSGTLTVSEGSEVTLNERRYEVEQGTITFLDERRIVPSFDLRLRTEASGYDVVLSVTGEPGATETTLTSDPGLPEPDIMALLVTGRTLDDMRGEEYDVAREQVLSYLVGRVGSSLGRGLERATGLSEVRLEPSLIANETDPGARLTIAQDLTDDLRLVYSTDLADANDQIWVARYDLTRRFQGNVVRQSDGTYRFDFRHDV
ncbi:MAG: translocation/assembly module TamB domain-containing protein, partial [Vicinamibacterales bacterium]